jgi:predicted CXXCH cytochrome family protein
MLIVLSGFLAVSMYWGIAWGQHENITCAACHDKTPEELKNYVHDSSVFPVSARCLACHDAGMDVSGLNPPYVINSQQELAGGSFSPTIGSDEVGHNILSVDRDLGLTPPGGAPLDDFGCLSCHDAHDNGNFRSLKKITNGYTTWVEALADPNYRQNTYITGINDFCGACHQHFNRTGSSRGTRGWRQHPVGITIAGAQHADFSHWSRLPDRITQAEYPSGSSSDLRGARLICLSCHRAHASPYQNALRWDYSQNVRGCLECHSF